MRRARMLFLVFAAAFGLSRPAPAAPTTPAGQTQSLEAFTSTIFQQHQSSFSGIGVRLRIQSPRLAPGFSIAPSIEYWRNQSKITTFEIETTRKDATMAAVLRYDVQRQGFQPYFGAGLGIHFLGSEVDAPSLGLNDASDTLIKGGLAMLAGVRFGLAGKLGNVFELEHHYVPDHSQLKMNWGLSYDF